MRELATWPFFMIKRTCPECGKRFYIKPSVVKRGQGVFCSKLCGGMAYSKKFSGDKSPNFKGAIIDRVCPICGEIFHVYASGIKRGQGKFCSISCRSKEKIKENNPNWKGGNYSKQSAIRTSLRNKQWIKDVFNRDKFTCQGCGQIGNELHAHHLKHFSDIFKELEAKYPLLDLVDMAKGYESFWDISNGRTLCKLCHKKVHKNDKKISRDGLGIASGPR